MRVKDLIKALQALDQNLDVVCYEEGPTPIQSPGPLDLGDVSEALAEMRRVEGRPVLTFGSGPNSRKIVIIGVTSDF